MGTRKGGGGGEQGGGGEAGGARFPACSALHLSHQSRPRSGTPGPHVGAGAGARRTARAARPGVEGEPVETVLQAAVQRLPCRALGSCARRRYGGTAPKSGVLFSDPDITDCWRGKLSKGSPSCALCQQSYAGLQLLQSSPSAKQHH